MRRPRYIARMALGMMQLMFLGQVLLGYTLSAKHAHKFVGYLEEEAFKHYTELIKEIDRKGSPIAHWKTTPAPQ
jgi:ubiquinol oxidase